MSAARISWSHEYVAALRMTHPATGEAVTRSVVRTTHPAGAILPSELARARAAGRREARRHNATDKLAQTVTLTSGRDAVAHVLTYAVRS